MTRAKNFMNFLKEKGSNPFQAAKRSGVSYSTIKSFMKNPNSSMAGTKEQALAEAYNTTIAIMFGGENKNIAISGCIAITGEIIPYEDSFVDIEHIPPPPGCSDTAEAWRAEDGSVLVFDGPEREPNDLLNYKCLIHTTDNKIFFRTLNVGSEHGKYTLTDMGLKPIVNVSVKSVRALHWIRPVLPSAA